MARTQPLRNRASTRYSHLRACVVGQLGRQSLGKTAGVKRRKNQLEPQAVECPAQGYLCSERGVQRSFSFPSQHAKAGVGTFKSQALLRLSEESRVVLTEKWKLILNCTMCPWLLCLWHQLWPKNYVNPSDWQNHSTKPQASCSFTSKNLS